MAEINSSASASPGRAHKTIRVDLTPMVDLGFLLISFFIFTTQITKPVGMKFYMPADSLNPTPVKQTVSLTLMPTVGNKVYAYEGLAKDNSKAGIYSTNDLVGLRQLLIKKREAVKKMTGDPSDVIVLIKPDKDCSYQTLVDLLDEMIINAIRRYAIEERDADDERLARL